MNRMLLGAISLALPLLSLSAAAAPELVKITANDRPLTFTAESVRSTVTAGNLIFFFKTEPPADGHFYQARLDGLEGDWKAQDCFMYVYANFYTADEELIERKQFPVTGRSPGWQGNVESSSFTHRRETLTAPAGADTLMFGVSSAGPPRTMGVYLINNFAVWRNDAPFHRLQIPADGARPHCWNPDGIRLDLAKILTVRNQPALALTDSSPVAHTEWHTIKRSLPKISAGETLTLEWDEMYNIGFNDLQWFAYRALPAGEYTLRVGEMDGLGAAAAPEYALSVSVVPPLWQRIWFQICAATAAVLLLTLALWLIIHARTRRRLREIEQAVALERERLRITRDIHDDLGARLTHLSLISERARDSAASPAAAGEQFEKIAALTRHLVGTLRETIWTINPERDNLEALVTFLCQMVQSLCEPADIHCRFDVPREIHPVPLSSETRHQICLLVKEAVNNAIKHSGTRDITLTVSHGDGGMTVGVTDSGKGFDPAVTVSGNGLQNMRRRVESLGGGMELLSDSGGTTLRFCFPLR